MTSELDEKSEREYEITSTDYCHTKGIFLFIRRGNFPLPSDTDTRSPSADSKGLSLSQAAGRAPGWEFEQIKVSHYNLRTLQFPRFALHYSGKAASDSGPETLHVD